MGQFGGSRKFFGAIRDAGLKGKNPGKAVQGLLTKPSTSAIGIPSKSAVGSTPAKKKPRLSIPLNRVLSKSGTGLQI